LAVLQANPIEVAPEVAVDDAADEISGDDVIESDDVAEGDETEILDGEVVETEATDVTAEVTSAD
jgi:hypothetical protein